MELCRIRVKIDDTPGRLAAVAGALAQIDANICEVDLHAVDGRSRADELLVDLGRPMDLRAVEVALAEVGCQVVHLATADAHDLTDPVTRSLELAYHAVTAADPGAFVRAVRQLVRAEHGRLVSQDEALRLADGPVHQAALSGLSQCEQEGTRSVAAVPFVHAGRAGVLTLEREMPAFTPTEIARIRALARVGEAAHAERATTDIGSSRGGRRSMAPNTAPEAVVLRSLRGADADALERFLGRCRSSLLQSHPLYGVADDPRIHLERLLNDGVEECGIGAEIDGDLVGIAHAMAHSDQRTATVSFLVSETHQRHGVASMLLDGLCEMLRPRGIDRLEALALPGDTALVSLLRGLGAPLRMRRDSDAVRISVSLSKTGRRNDVRWATATV